MNGAQDLGGMMGFGPVMPEPDEPIFHADWERRVLALTLAAGVCGRWTGDASRHARESLHPAIYLTTSYYEIWLAALENIAVGRGLVTAEEQALGRAIARPGPVSRVLHGGEVATVLAAGFPSSRRAAAEPRFTIGSHVRTKVMHPKGHTRLPGYVRGRTGVVEAIRGCFVFPDTNAEAGGGEHPQWCYAVAFDSRELWGEDAAPGLTVNVDAFEPYLDAARIPA